MATSVAIPDDSHWDVDANGADRTKKDHAAWHVLKTCWSTRTCRDAVCQPLSILRFASAAVSRLGRVMKVILLDGFDKTTCWHCVSGADVLRV